MLYFKYVYSIKLKVRFKSIHLTEAQRRGTCSFYETATPDDIPLEYHKYFERKWHADKEAAEKGETPKKYKAV